MNLNEIKFVEARLLRKKSCALTTKKKGEKRDKKNGRRNTPHDTSGFDANSRGDFDARRLMKAFLPL